MNTNVSKKRRHEKCGGNHAPNFMEQHHKGTKGPLDTQHVSGGPVNTHGLVNKSGQKPGGVNINSHHTPSSLNKALEIKAIDHPSNSPSDHTLDHGGNSGQNNMDESSTQEVEVVEETPIDWEPAT